MSGDLVCPTFLRRIAFVPTYAYRCTACSHAFDVFQKFTDDPLTKCPECDASLRKVFQPVGIVFKGSGWYVNDSRKPEPDANKGAAKGDEKATDKKDSKTSNPDSTVKTPVPSDASSSAASAPAKVAAV